MSTQNSRKRAAPGASPIVPIQRNMQQPYATDHAAVPNPLVQWNGAAAGDATSYANTSAHGDNAYGLAQTQPAYPQTVGAPSNSLARRQTNRALVPTNPRGGPYDTSAERWAGFADDSILVPQNTVDAPVEQDNVEVLEELAQKAKRDSQAKRKQIPPFVQKLSSFLEERKNEDLIRWSEKGDSFIVLDEDEFAKTLIPELFKHNNYASFVRQLNMYGFHKCVGLSDNSMRASERKNKSPSEYSNPYFRRGHPNLLWLINKPKSGGKSKKGSKNQDGDNDSDEDGGHDEATGHQAGPSSNAAGRSLPAAGTDTQPLAKQEMALIREELHKVREQQKLILGAISRLQRNNNDLYNQALMFQSQHDRHQNSINAILNFLANVFRKTLEDQGNPQNVGDIISSLITNQGQQASHLGSVVDLGDFIQAQTNATASLGGPPAKRARGLLPPIPNHNEPAVKSSRSSSAGSTPYHPVGLNSEMGHVTELVDASDTPPSLRQELETNPHERMMKIINDHNATNSPVLDLPKATELVNNAPNALSNDQRSKLANFMAGQTTSSPTPLVPTASDPLANMAPTMAPPSQDNTAPPSLSPILRSPTMPVPSLHHISTNQADLEQLKRLQNEQEAKISELTEILGPLSPSGHIPGLDDSHEAYFDAPPVDLDQFFDSNAFLNDAHFGDGSDFNFNLDTDGGLNGLNSGASGQNIDTPSPTGTEEIQRDDLGVMNSSPDHDNKRRRVG